MSRITTWINTNSDSASSREAHELEKACVLFSPLSLLLITVVFGWSIYYFGLQERYWAWIALAALIGLTLVAALVHRRESGERIVSDSQVRSSNDFTAAQWLPCRYNAHIGKMRPITRKDEAKSNKLCAAMAEQLISIGAYEKTGQTRRTIKGKTQEMVRLVELYTVTVNGRGYVLIEPFGAEIQLCASVDVRLIHRALREAGLKDWEVERISYDDDVMLFMLRDPNVSSAYDLTGAR